MDEAVAKWVRVARRDLRSAAVLPEAGDAENALYLCQQAVEKALKALLQAGTDDAPPRIHSLMRLCQLAEVWHEMGLERQMTIHALDPHVAVGRYPPTEDNLRAGPGRAEAARLLAEGKEVVTWLLSRLT